MRNCSLAILACVVASACATPYAPPSGKPVAHVMLARDMLRANQTAFVYHKGQDSAGKSSMVVNGNSNEYDIRFPIEADVPTVLMTDLMTRTGSWDAYCAAYVSFQPMAGRTYRVSTAGYGETPNCKTVVLDVETNTPPDDFREVPGPMRPKG